MTGIVFDIQRYSIHDGPGIRTVVFLKGCPLWCLWCDNPESQRRAPEVLFFRASCTGCNTCLDACPLDALSGVERDGLGSVQIDRSVCDGCGACAESCAAQALRMAGKCVSVAEVIDEVEEDRAFYRNSGGGVTLSGGEPSAQPEFASAFLRECQERGIHTAVETSGYCEWGTLSKIVRYANLVLCDLKHMDARKHREFTGVPNELVLKNVKRMAREGIPMIIRLPLVPGYTDGDENVKTTAEFVATLGTVARIDLVPYHQLGAFKYEKLGREYRLASVRPPGEDDLERCAELVRSYGLQVQLGG